MLMTPDLKAIIDQAILHFNGLEVADVEKVVVLTKDQATELECFKRLGFTLEDWVTNKKEAIEPHSVIHELTLDEMAKALYHPDGYEIKEPKFKAGDKVMLWGGVVTLKDSRELLGSVAWSVEENNGVHLYENDLVRATPEEVYWLGALGRDYIGDFREGDIYVDNAGKLNRLYSSSGFHGQRSTIEDAKFNYENKIFKGIYPAESFKPYPEEEAK